MTTDTTTRLADIRRRVEESASVYGWELGDDERFGLTEQWLDDIPWLLDQLDAANAELATLRIERDEWKKRAIYGLRDLTDDQAGVFSETAQMLAENVALHAELATLRTVTDDDPATADRSEWQERAEVAATALVEMAEDYQVVLKYAQKCRDAFRLIMLDPEADAKLIAAGGVEVAPPQVTQQ